MPLIMHLYRKSKIDDSIGPSTHLLARTGILLLESKTASECYDIKQGVSEELYV